MPHVSLPGPLPYEAPRSGSEREVPVKRGMRPYAERLRMSGELVRANEVPQDSLRNSALTAAIAALFLGAVIPIIIAIPAFGRLVIGFSPGYDVLGIALLNNGWWGALLVVVAGVSGVFVMAIAKWHAGSTQPEVRALKVLMYGLTIGLASMLLMLTAGAGANGFAAFGALAMLAVMFALYGCWCIAARQNWLGAVAGAVMVFSFTSMLMGVVAGLLLLYGAKAFPGQVVARNPWKRTEVAMEPLEAPSEVEEDPQGVVVRVLRPYPQGLFIAKVSLVFGAFAPFVLALPWFGVALFGPLILLLWPLTIPLVWSASSLQASFIILSEPAAFGPLVPGALFTLLWLFVLPVAGGIIGARAVGKRSRPWAAIAGAVMLLVSGRLLFGVAALIAVGYTWPLFDAHKEEAEAPKDQAAGAAPH